VLLSIRLAALLLLTFASRALATEDHHDYVVSVDDDLSNLTVKACPGGSQRGLKADSHQAANYLVSAVATPGSRTLTARRGRLVLHDDERCVTYRVDMARAAQANRRYAGIGSGNRAPASPDWLGRASGDLPHQVSFKLAPHTRVSVPWQKLTPATALALRYRIPPSPRSDAAISVFGQFLSCDIQLGQSRLDVAVVTGKQARRGNEPAQWILQAAQNVTLAHGEVPHSAAQIVSHPDRNQQPRH